MSIITTNNQYYTDIAEAIRAKNGTETLYKPSEMAAAIQAISGGGGEPEPPDDGKTRLYITVPANAMPDRPPPRNQVPLYIQQTVANGVTIDWGDGTEPETLPGTGTVNTTHIYEQAGDYVISLDPADGCELGFGANSYPYCVMGSTINYGKAYCNMLQKVYIGKNVFTIRNYAFYHCGSLSTVVISNEVTSIGISAFEYCYNLTSVVIPDSVVSIESSAFSYCYSLTTMVIPNGVASIESSAFSYCYSLTTMAIPDSVTSIKNNSFSYCYSLASISISDGVTSISNSAFYNCCSLASISIPDGVTSIGTSVFRYCSGMKEYHFLSPTPPTLNGTSVFLDIPSDCVIYVPVGSAEAYKTATNWITVADHIQEEPA